MYVCLYVMDQHTNMAIKRPIQHISYIYVGLGKTVWIGTWVWLSTTWTKIIFISTIWHMFWFLPTENNVHYLYMVMQDSMENN